MLAVLDSRVDNSICSPLSYVAELPGIAGQLDMSAFDEAAVQDALRVVRAAQRSLDGIVVRAGIRANELAAAGRSAPAEETMRGAGAVSARQARREADRAKAAANASPVEAAVRDGVVSGEHVDVLARLTRPLTDQQRQQLDHRQLMAKAKTSPVETFERHLRRLVQQITQDPGGREETAAKQAASELRHWFDHESGMGKVFATLDPELYERVTSAVDRHTTTMANATGETKDANLAARALGELVGQGCRSKRGQRKVPSITVVVDQQTLLTGPHAATVCQTENGHDIAADSVSRMCCDAVVRRVVLDDAGVPIDVGRKHRTATDAQWAALKSIHASCAWDGCGAPISWCQAHHIQEWERGGSTDLNNLIPLCSTHHHRVHEGRWRLKLNQDRSLQIFRPDGHPAVTTARPMRC